MVGATFPDQIAQVRRLIGDMPLLIPGVGAQGGSVHDLAPLARDGALPSLVPSSRALLPSQPLETAAFRHAVTTSARWLAEELAAPIV